MRVVDRFSRLIVGNSDRVTSPWVKRAQERTLPASAHGARAYVDRTPTEDGAKCAECSLVAPRHAFDCWGE